MRAVTIKDVKTCLFKRIDYSKDAIGKRAAYCVKNGRFLEKDWNWIVFATDFCSAKNRCGEKFENWIRDVMTVREEYPEDLKDLIRIDLGLEELLSIIGSFNNDDKIYCCKGSEMVRIGKNEKIRVVLKNTEAILIRTFCENKSWYILRLTSIVV